MNENEEVGTNIAPIDIPDFDLFDDGKDEKHNNNSNQEQIDILNNVELDRKNSLANERNIREGIPGSFEDYNQNLLFARHMNCPRMITHNGKEYELYCYDFEEVKPGDTAWYTFKSLEGENDYNEGDVCGIHLIKPNVQCTNCSPFNCHVTISPESEATQQWLIGFDPNTRECYCANHRTGRPPLLPPPPPPPPPPSKIAPISKDIMDSCLAYHTEDEVSEIPNYEPKVRKTKRKRDGKEKVDVIPPPPPERESKEEKKEEEEDEIIPPSPPATTPPPPPPLPESEEIKISPPSRPPLAPSRVYQMCCISLPHRRTKEPVRFEMDDEDPYFTITQDDTSFIIDLSPKNFPDGFIIHNDGPSGPHLALKGLLITSTSKKIRIDPVPTEWDNMFGFITAAEKLEGNTEIVGNTIFFKVDQKSANEFLKQLDEKEVICDPPVDYLFSNYNLETGILIFTRPDNFPVSNPIRVEYLIKDERKEAPPPPTPPPPPPPPVEEKKKKKRKATNKIVEPIYMGGPKDTEAKNLFMKRYEAMKHPEPEGYDEYFEKLFEGLSLRRYNAKAGACYDLRKCQGNCEAKKYPPVFCYSLQKLSKENEDSLGSWFEKVMGTSDLWFLRSENTRKYLRKSGIFAQHEHKGQKKCDHVNLVFLHKGTIICENSKCKFQFTCPSGYQCPHDCDKKTKKMPKKKDKEKKEKKK